MTEVGLRELRQNASDVVRRAQEGEHFTVTVAGRPAATLGPVRPVRPGAWRTWDEVKDVLQLPADPDWDFDRELVDSAVLDPWER